MSGRVEIVAVAGINRPHPVYHRFGHTYTRCGLPLNIWYAGRARRDHADLYARPCKHCYPEADQ